MKKLITLLFLVLLHPAFSATYYVKSSGGTGSGLDDANAWSFSKLQATTLASGSVVLFNRGDVFYGNLTIGTSNLTFGAYGSGNDPVLSGFTQLTSWTLSSGNVYFATLDVTSLNGVTLDGVMQRMGRYPNTGYLTYTSHSTNASISGQTIGELPFNPAGAEAVIKKQRWIIDRHPVTSRSSNTLAYTNDNNYGNNNLYEPVDGNGFFLQGHLSTLDQEGEWFYDKTAKRLYVHFGTGSPSGRVVKASTLSQTLTVNTFNTISFSNITFEGSNLYGVYLIGTSNITFTNCNFRNQGGDGLYAADITNLTVTGGSVSNSYNTGIRVEYSGTTINISGVTVTNSGIVPGSGRSGDATQEGINIHGTGATVQNCTVLNSGFNGIDFSGAANAYIFNNTVNTFCTVKDDGAGIYTFESVGANRLIKKNTVINAVGSFDGAESNYWEAYGKAAGIYLDGGTAGTTIDSNTVTRSNWGGIFVNAINGHTVSNNTITDCSSALLIHSYNGNLARSLTITGNKLKTFNSTQVAFELHQYVDDDITLLGTFTNNYYGRTGSLYPIRITREFSGGVSADMTLTSWQSTFGKDAGSQSGSLVPATPGGKFLTIGGKILYIPQ